MTRADMAQTNKLKLLHERFGGKKKYNSKDSLAVKQLKAKIKITSNVTFGKLYNCLSITSFKIRLQLRKKILTSMSPQYSKVLDKYFSHKNFQGLVLPIS